MASKKSIVSLSSLPDVAMFFHPTKNSPLTPDDFSKGSSKKVWWTCKKGHEYDASVNNRTKWAFGACPVCSGHRVQVGFNDLATTDPKLASQVHPDSPIQATEVSRGSRKKPLWVCSLGHTWSASVADRVTYESGCPYCSNKKVLSGFNDLATIAPEIAAQWLYEKNGALAPDAVGAGSTKKIWWKCSLGHEWKAAIVNRVRGGTHCPTCAGQKAVSGETDLATIFPEVARTWHPTKNGTEKPSDFLPQSNLKKWWKCEKGHEWLASIQHRSNGRGCPVCNGKKVLSGFNDLLTDASEIAADWHPTKNGTLSPAQVTSGSAKKVWWQCPAGHEWETWVYARKAGNGCPSCANQQSTGEQELRDVLLELGFNVQERVRDVLDNGQEIDLYLPEKKLAVEFNGTYWHSESGGKGKDYHRLKYESAQRAGVRLIQVWEDDWLLRRQVVIRGLAHRLGVIEQAQSVLPEIPEYWLEKIGARNTKVLPLTYAESAVFLNDHHIQGATTGTHYLGLKDAQDRLRAILVVKSTGEPKEYTIERYASAGVVAGGFTKLLSWAENYIQVDKWITFADLEISEGSLYESTGFQRDKVLPPDYSYLVGKQRVHKFNYRISRFQRDEMLKFEEGMSERELAALNGLPRVWDSGKVRYVKDVCRS